MIHREEDVRDAGEFESATPGNEGDPRFLAYLIVNNSAASDFSCELRQRDTKEGRVVFDRRLGSQKLNRRRGEAAQDEDEEETESGLRSSSSFTNDPDMFPHLDACLIRYTTSLIGSQPSSISFTVRCDPRVGGGWRGNYGEEVGDVIGISRGISTPVL